VKNALFSFHPGLERPRQRSRRGLVPFNRRVAQMIRSHAAKRPRGGGGRGIRGSGGVNADLVSALVNLGYKSDVATKAAAGARGSTFDEQLRDVLGKVKTMKKNSRKNKNKTRRVFPGSYAAEARALQKIARAAMRKGKKQSTKKKTRRNAGRRKTSNRLTKAELKILKRRGDLECRRLRSLEARRSNPRKPKTSRRRRRPVPKRPRFVKAPFSMTSGQLKKYARALSRATGRRVVIKSK